VDTVTILPKKVTVSIVGATPADARTCAARRPPFAATSRPDLDTLPYHMPPRFPKRSEISAALGALGVYAQVPSERELAEHAIAAGGERVLAAALADALYGAAIGYGMLAEDQMLEQGDNRAERLSLARAQTGDEL
jgi:hypothetical protein